jgi:polyketide synthase 1/15
MFAAPVGRPPASRFADGIAAVRVAGGTRFLVAGLDSGLTDAITAVLGDAGGVTEADTVVAMLRKGRPEPGTAMATVVALFVTGAEIDWPAVWAGDAPAPIALPKYAFQRRRYWCSTPSATGMPPFSCPLPRSARPV